MKGSNMNHALWTILISVSLLFVGGCSTLSSSSTPQSFTYQNIPVTTESAKSGEGSTILFHGAPTPLSGSAISVGDKLRSASLTSPNLSRTNLSDGPGTVRIISLVPSVDTKVCEQQTHHLSEKNGGLDPRIRLITISIDTPFAQKRFAEEAHIANVEFLSDYRGGLFGRAHGLLLEDPHVLTRAVMVVDTQNVIRYLQITPDLGQLPDLEHAFNVAGSLLP